MKLFEEISCSLCDNKEYEVLYSSKQYADKTIGNVDIDIVMCKQCGFIYQNPQLTQEALENHYKNSSSGAVFSLNHDNSRYSILLNERKTFIEDVIDKNSINTICDAGGGKGIFLSSLSVDEEIKRYLIEPSDAIFECKDENIIKINDFVENIDNRDDMKFDLLMSISSLEHFKNPTTVLDSFNRLLNDEGYLLIEVPNSLKPYKTFAEFYSYEHVNHFTIKTLTDFLNKSGFYPVKVEESKSVPNIRVLAKKSGASINETVIKKIFKNYILEKEELLLEIKDKVVLPLGQNNMKKFAIYGAGEHTKFILEHVDILEKVDVFIDSDSSKHGKTFFGKTIISPLDIDSYEVSHILISSHDFEKEIYETIKKYSKEDIDIITLYSKVDD